MCDVVQNTTGRTERRWLNCLGLATWPEVVRRYCLFHPAKHQDAIITDAASAPLLPLFLPPCTCTHMHACNARGRWRSPMASANQFNPAHACRKGMHYITAVHNNTL